MAIQETPLAGNTRIHILMQVLTILVSVYKRVWYKLFSVSQGRRHSPTRVYIMMPSVTLNTTNNPFCVLLPGHLA